MTSAYARTITRSIRGSLGRFLAIVGIAALGCGLCIGLALDGGFTFGLGLGFCFALGALCGFSGDALFALVHAVE